MDEPHLIAAIVNAMLGHAATPDAHAVLRWPSAMGTSAQ
jgi:hypothetical protein